MLFSKACLVLSVALCGITLVTTVTEDDTATATTVSISKARQGTRGTRGSRGTRGTRVSRISRRTRGTRVSKVSGVPRGSRNTRSVYQQMLYRIEKALTDMESSLTLDSMSTIESLELSTTTRKRILFPWTPV